LLSSEKGGVGKTFDEKLFTTDELFKKVMLVFNSQPQRKVVTKLDVCCFNLVKAESVQESLFETSRERRREVSKALNSINNKWGEWTIYSARMFGRQKKSLTESLLAE
jgi:DNA polymerase-4